jgi:hypothetical protein
MTAEELRSAINHRITGILLEREERDRYRYGKERLAQEAHINQASS